MSEPEDLESLWANAPFVCPGCYAVGEEPCLPGCIDAKIELREHEREDEDREDEDRDQNDDELDRPDEFSRRQMLENLAALAALVDVNPFYTADEKETVKRLLAETDTILSARGDS